MHRGSDAYGKLEAALERDRHCTKPIAGIVHELEVVAIPVGGHRRVVAGDDRSATQVRRDPLERGRQIQCRYAERRAGFDDTCRSACASDRAEPLASRHLAGTSFCVGLSVRIGRV